MFLRSIVFLVVFVPILVTGQDRCSIEQYETIRRERNKLKETSKDFEQWIGQQISKRKLQAFSTQETQEETYTIPVVFHIVHKGEAVGNGVNISDAQIFSQMKVLNEDYQRLNADASSTPTEFQSVAGSLSIQFVLAKQDPNGNATNGINRVRGTQNSWTINDDAALKSQSYWPAEDYLNIWVCDMGSGLIGYAQFPVSNTLQGLEDAPENRLTDGVIIDYVAIGSIDDGNFLLDGRYDRGRTATHEIGHFLGLRHTWGDDGSSCTGTDYVADTPNQAASTAGCPAHPRISCNTTNMIQNFLDYTNDVCMNLFTKGQIDRMVAVLTNSPRRASLLTSAGARAPQGSDLITDVAVVGYSNPSPVTCQKINTPTITIKNAGTAVIFNFKVTTTLNTNTSQTQPIVTSGIPPNSEHSFTLNAISMTEGTNEIKIDITEPNGTLDQTPTNNMLTIRSVVNSKTDILPLRQNWENPFGSVWSMVSQGGSETWKATTTNYGNSLFYSGFNNVNAGAESWLASPILNLTNAPEGSLFFDVSYGRKDSRNEQLRVLASKDCGVTYDVVPVYAKEGASLSTGTSSTQWLPADGSQWRREYVNLSNLVGQKQVRLAFVITNGNGNNVYLDNLEFFVDDDPFPIRTEERYTLYTGSEDFRVTFNLATRQDVRLQIYNLTGQLVIDNLLYDVLNQTYDVDFSPVASGIYLVRMQIGNELSAKKVFVSR